MQLCSQNHLLNQFHIAPKNSCFGTKENFFGFFHFSYCKITDAVLLYQCCVSNADVAQQVERILGKDEVTGSNPVISSTDHPIFWVVFLMLPKPGIAGLKRAYPNCTAKKTIKNTAENASKALQRRFLVVLILVQSFCKRRNASYVTSANRAIHGSGADSRR